MGWTFSVINNLRRVYLPHILSQKATGGWAPPGWGFEPLWFLTIRTCPPPTAPPHLYKLVGSLYSWYSKSWLWWALGCFYFQTLSLALDVPFDLGNWRILQFSFGIFSWTVSMMIFILLFSLFSFLSTPIFQMFNSQTNSLIFLSFLISYLIVV